MTTRVSRHQKCKTAFLLPNQHCQRTEGIYTKHKNNTQTVSADVRLNSNPLKYNITEYKHTSFLNALDTIYLNTKYYLFKP